MTIEDQIKDEKVQYDINREAAKISALLSGKLDKYEYLTGEEILPSNQQQIIEQTKFTYSPLGKALEKQTKTIEVQGKKQVDALKSFKPSDEELSSIKDFMPKEKLNPEIINEIKGSLWQYFRDEPNDDLRNSKSLKSKIKITGKTPANDNEKDVEIMVPLKCLSNFWRTLEIPLINCEVNLILTWSSTFVITNSNGAGTFEITDTKLYVPVVTLSTQENTKLLQLLKSGFKRVINWNKYLSKPELLAPNPNLNHLIEPSFQGVNRLFVLAFENDEDRTDHEKSYLPTVEIKDYNIMINGENFFDQPIKNNKVTYENIRKVAAGQGDDYTTGCLLDYSYFMDTYKMITVDLSKQQALDADPRAIQQINFTANLDRAGNTRVYFILEEAKETILDFSQGTVKVL